MSDLTTLLQAANIKRAVVIDDAYDQIPLANDLSQDEQNWSQFFEDLNQDDTRLIKGLFPRYDELRADELRSNNEFVAVLWNHRAELRREIAEPLFERYKKDKAQDLDYLETLTSCLAKYNIQCATAGRSFDTEAAKADLIVIDLYLGSTQDDEAIKTSVSGLGDLIRKRLANPPLVVLMSRSARLEEKRKEFRDKSGLFESAFRIIRKTELAEEGKLPRLLMRLAAHYRDSIKLAAFLDAWQTGLEKACARTANLIRTLDLADLAQIQQMSLVEEGEPPGSYLVDVFDRVLQHEVEREGAIIDAAIALNGLDSRSYPPPYVAGSPDLQDLVFRSIFQNPERLRLAQAEGSRVALGDVLRRKSPRTSGVVPTASTVEATRGRLNEIRPDEVLVVLTPACDLQRKEAKGILLLTGELKPLEPVSWSYTESPIRTPIITLTTGERFWIKWNLKHIETITHAELESLLEAEHGFGVIGRLRESHALELQQKLLSSLGRVGLLTPMPGTFPMNVEIYLPAPTRRLFRVEVPGLAVDCGVCFVGRSGPREMRLILCEDDCEAICKAIGAVDADQIHPETRELVRVLYNSGDLLSAMEKGIVLPSPQQEGFKPIVVKTATPVESSADELTIGWIRRGSSISEAELKPGEVRKAGIVLAVTDKSMPP